MSTPTSFPPSTNLPVCIPGSDPLDESAPPQKPADPFARPPAPNTCEAGGNGLSRLPEPDHPVGKASAATPATPRPSTPPALPQAPAMRSGEVQRRGNELANAAVAQMIREKGTELRDLQQNIDRLAKHSLARSYGPQIESLKAKRDAIIRAYNPSMGQANAVAPRSFPNPKGAQAAPAYAGDILPTKGSPFGTYGGRQWKHDAVRTSVSDAYAYTGKTEGYQVANDLERLARAGYTQVHVATGAHGTRQGGLLAEPKFLREDLRSIREVMQRNPGLTVVPYDMADPLQAAEFYKVQALTADGKLSGGATLAGLCHSAVCLGGPPPAAAQPAPAIAPPQPGPVTAPAKPAPAIAPATPVPAAAPAKPPVVVQAAPKSSPGYGYGAISVGLGINGIRDGLRDPDAAIGAAKVAAGGAQVIGGGSHALAVATGSEGLARFGAGAARVGNVAGGVLVMVDLNRDLQRKFDPDDVPVKGTEAVYDGASGALKLAGVLFPEVALGAITIHYGAEPLARKAAEAATPTFVEGISRAYGIPSSNVWGMH